MILKFLGRGSAFNTKEGNTSAYIKQDDNLLLIDCGESIFERIINKHLLDDVKSVNVLITHLDSDHVGSLSSLIYYCYYCKHIITTVWFPNYDLPNLLKLQGQENGEDYNFKLLDKYNFLNITSNIEVQAIPVSHITSLNCFGYLLSLENINKLVWYSGDCKKVKPEINEYISYIDEFYQDTCLADYEGNVHTSLRLLDESIPKEYRNKVYCIHLDCDELIDKVKDLGFNVVEVS